MKTIVDSVKDAINYGQDDAWSILYHSDKLGMPVSFCTDAYLAANPAVTDYSAMLLRSSDKLQAL